MRGGRRGEGGAEEDDFVETMLLVLLCLAVSFLIYLRNRWAERRRREVGERGAPRGDQDGVFPQPGDPARDEWAVLR